MAAVNTAAARQATATVAGRQALTGTRSFAARLDATSLVPARSAPTVSTRITGSGIVGAAVSQATEQAAAAAGGAAPAPAAYSGGAVYVPAGGGHGGGSGSSSGGGFSGGGASGGGSSGRGSEGEDDGPGSDAIDGLVASYGRPVGSIDQELARSSDLMMQMIHLQMQEMDERDDLRSNMEKVKHETKKNTVSNVR